MATPPLGWIEPKDRTQAQNDAHDAALKKMGRFAMPGYVDPPKGTKILLTDFWKHPDVMADVGFEFTGFHQLTGSCVGASGGNWAFTLAAIQRTLAVNPTKAFLPWWLFDYGKTRQDEGDRGQGEGAIDSVLGERVKKGVLPYDASQLPAFKTDDGLYVTEAIEMKWSDGASIDPKWEQAASASPISTVAPLSSTDEIRASIVNGYPVIDGCDNYVGNGSIKGSGADAYVVGHYDGRGGHSTCILGVWNHPNDGWLYLYSNQWPTSTYQKDPAGAGRCCVWIPDVEMAKLFRTGGSGGETMAASHLTYFPAQPSILDFFV